MVLHGSTAIRQYRQQQERHRKQVSTARILKPLRQLAGDVARGAWMRSRIAGQSWDGSGTAFPKTCGIRS